MAVVVVATRNVVSSQHQHEFVGPLVASGRDQNASEALREGLRLLERQEAEDVAMITLRPEAATKGWADLAAGRCGDIADESLDDFIGQLDIDAAARTQEAG